MALKCKTCGSKHVSLTGYAKVVSTEPLDIREQYSCDECGKTGFINE